MHVALLSFFKSYLNIPLYSIVQVIYIFIFVIFLVVGGRKIGFMLGKCYTTVSDVIFYYLSLIFFSIQVKEFAF